MIKVGVIGANGFLGLELLRILSIHPKVKISKILKRENDIEDEFTHLSLLNLNELQTSNIDDFKSLDCVFLSLPHGSASEYVKELIDKVKIIDLSSDYRIHDATSYEAYYKTSFDPDIQSKFTYGFIESSLDNIKKSSNIANPGCFATAIQLGVLPLISVNNNSEEIHTHAITGSTGAGLKLTQTSHFSWRNNNVSWYKPFTHQHLNEGYKTIEKKYNINFIPIRGNFSRGIFCTSYIKTELDIDSIYKIYFDYYNDHPFTVVSNQEIHLKQVINTNKCLIHLKKVEGKLLITSIIDNLIKGASGQAIQNMNLLYKYPENLGLK